MVCVCVCLCACVCVCVCTRACGASFAFNDVAASVFRLLSGQTEQGTCTLSLVSLPATRRYLCVSLCGRHSVPHLGREMSESEKRQRRSQLCEVHISGTVELIRYQYEKIQLSRCLNVSQQPQRSAQLTIVNALNIYSGMYNEFIALIMNHVTPKI